MPTKDPKATYVRAQRHENNNGDSEGINKLCKQYEKSSEEKKCSHKRNEIFHKKTSLPIKFPFLGN